MSGYLNLDYLVQLDWLKLKARESGYEFLNFADYGLESILSKLNNTDMFSSGGSKLIIKFNKEDLEQAERILELESGSDLIIITTNVDKRTSIYKKLNKLGVHNPEWTSNSQSPKEALISLAEGQLGIKLKSTHLLSTKDLDYDELFSQLKLKVIESDQKEVDLATLEAFGSGARDQSMFDAVLGLLKKAKNTDPDSAIKSYGAEAVWNTIIWYVDLALQVQIIGSRTSSIKLNSYTASKVSNLKISKQGINSLYNYEKMLKSGLISAENAVKMFLKQL